jgi:hypothetical protein
MKTLRLALVTLVISGGLSAQEPPPVFTPDVSSAPAPEAGTAVLRTPAQLEQLVGPIALYPDALLAVILPATTAPADIVLAARYLRDFPNDRSQIEHRAWEESVKSLTNYPEVLQWLDENLHWTKELGEAFVAQPSEVMEAVQRLRAKAQAAGTLVSTPQQQVLAEPEVIRIVPAQPDVIYVPRYDPEVVFYSAPAYYNQPFLTFGIGVPVGSWLAFDCDWRHRSIWVGDRHRRWTGHDWHRPVVPFAPLPVVVSNGYARSSPVRQWRPPPQPPRAAVTVTLRSSTAIARPSPIGSTYTRSYAPRPVGDTRRHDSAPAPAVASLPRASLPYHREEPMGPRPRLNTAPQTTSTAAIVAPSSAPVAPTVVTPMPASPAPTYGRNRENREPRVRSNPNYNASSAPAVAAPAAPTFVGPQAPANSAPPVRSYHRESAPSAPVHIAPLPMANNPGRSHVVSAPAPVAAPPAAVSAPPAPAAAPQPAAPAPARSEPDRRGGNRREYER